ncbi:MAG: branched-chain amino acid aminotransferase [Rhizobiales bacterium]|nr:branched-chain amino acid aminotransferase [Hyphomicrobiales bacterium]
MAELSQTWTWLEGKWVEGNPPITGPRSHAFWLGTSVFDGARSFEGVEPDLDRHCARLNRSAEALLLKPTMKAGEIAEIAREGVKKFRPGTAIYIRPMYWGEDGGVGQVAVDPESTRFLVCLYESPMPDPAKGGASVTLSPFRRPSLEVMPVNAKAGCLYPNSGRALVEARGRGFDNCIMLDMIGNVTELATANVWLAKNGVVATPAPNGAFLNGVTRQRTIALMKKAGIDVRETALSYKDFLEADEIFTTGNASKVMPITRIDARELQPGPMFRRARELYWDFAHG